MQNRVPLYPGRVRMTPVSEQTNVYDMERADQPTQVGTPLNAETLLSDETAEMYGFDPDIAVPDDLFQWLSTAGRITTGSYVGTGVYSSENPVVLTFPFEPKFLVISNMIITNNFGSECTLIWVCGSNNASVTNKGPSSTGSIAQYLVYVSQSGKELSWHSTSATYMNAKDKTYHYIAVG